MDEKEFKDLAVLLAVLGLTVSGERVERIAVQADAIANELMELRDKRAEAALLEQGITAIRKRRAK